MKMVVTMEHGQMRAKLMYDAIIDAETVIEEFLKQGYKVTIEPASRTHELEAQDAK